jgi:hypothetical protein
MMARIRSSSPAIHLNPNNELGAGEGNRTLDIQLGKLDDAQAFQEDGSKTAAFRAQSDQYVSAELQNSRIVTRRDYSPSFTARRWPPPPERNGLGRETEAEARDVEQQESKAAAESTQATCEKCGERFERRRSGGKAQRFCSSVCRAAFHNAERSANSSSTINLKPAATPHSPADTLPAADSENDFDWIAEDRGGGSVVIREQRAVAIYHNPDGDLVIRQERAWDQEEDAWIIINQENAQAFLDRLCEVMEIKSFP